MSALIIGTELKGGTYTLDKVLGQGGFGITYLAHETRSARLVAIKEFFPVGCEREGNRVQFPRDMSEREQQDAEQKFMSEARVLSKLRHPHIVGVDTTFEENHTAYMVMEFLPGQTLQEMTRSSKRPGRRGGLPEREAVAYIEQVGDALRLVHQTHLIHRDIKPENIMVCAKQRAVLLDFGLNKELGDPATHGTMRLTSAIRFGSPGYSPPEQYGKQDRFGPYTDIYALGATLYYLLTGVVPAEAPERMYGEDLASVRTLNPRVSERVNDAVMWALQLKGDQRPQTVQDFLDALKAERLGSKVPVAQPISTLSPPSVAHTLTGPATAAPLTMPFQPRSAQRGVPTAALALAAAPGSMALGVATRNSRVPGAVAQLPHRVYRHFKSGLLEILPRLMLLVALLALAFFYTRSQQRQTSNHLKSNGMAMVTHKKLGHHRPRH